LKNHLENVNKELSSTIHQCIVETLSFPIEKKYHRFFPLQQDEMIFPDGKTERYTIIEIMMMEGRSVETKKNLIKSLFSSIETNLGILPSDIEICIIESPASNWGFRGMTWDEIKLNYKINV